MVVVVALIAVIIIVGSCSIQLALISQHDRGMWSGAFVPCTEMDVFSGQLWSAFLPFLCVSLKYVRRENTFF